MTMQCPIKPSKEFNSPGTGDVLVPVSEATNGDEDVDEDVPSSYPEQPKGAALAVFLVLCLGCMVGYPAYGAMNSVVNGGFEDVEGTMPRGWTVPPHLAERGSATVDTANVHSGRRSLMLAPNGRNTPEGFAVYAPLDAAALQGKEVTVSGYVAVEGVVGTVAVAFKAGGVNWIPVSKETGGKFVVFAKTFSAPQSASEAALLLFVTGTRGRVWFDDLSVTSGSGSDLGATQRLTPPGRLGVAPGPGQANRINTDGWQDSAFISPDGRELYFSYLPFAQNDFMNIYLGKIKPEDVTRRGPDRPGNHGPMLFETYVSLRNTNGTWGPPRNLNINSNYNLYSAKLSLDGKELYYSIRDYAKNYGGDDIYFSRRQSDGTWSPPQNLGPNINTPDRDDHPCLSPDGTRLYFSRNKTEALGWEIYVSRKVNGAWQKAEKLPPPINQSRPETTANHQPFITADGKEFYFTRIQQLSRSNLKSDGTWGPRAGVSSACGIGSRLGHRRRQAPVLSDHGGQVSLGTSVLHHLGSGPPGRWELG